MYLTKLFMYLIRDLTVIIKQVDALMPSVLGGLAVKNKSILKTLKTF